MTVKATATATATVTATATTTAIATARVHQDRHTDVAIATSILLEATDIPCRRNASTTVADGSRLFTL